MELLLRLHLRRLSSLVVGAVVFVLTQGGAPARILADDLTFDVATFVGTGTTPSGTLTAEVKDISSGVVDVTLTSNLTSGTSQFISDWGFNYVSTFTDYTNLSIGFVSSTGGVSKADSIDSGAGSDFNPTSIGKFNLIFHWSGSDHTFGPGGSVTYQFTYTGTQTFNADTFIAQSTGGSDSQAPFYSAAKVQGIGTSKGSGELANINGPMSTTPEPSTLLIGGFGALGFLGYSWRRRRSQSRQVPTAEPSTP
jgi:hypothetical protein